jgi:hypothetical protein
MIVDLHGFISHKTTLNIILAAVRTWNLTYYGINRCYSTHHIALSLPQFVWLQSLSTLNCIRCQVHWEACCSISGVMALKIWQIWSCTSATECVWIDQAILSQKTVTSCCMWSRQASGRPDERSVLCTL